MPASTRRTFMGLLLTLPILTSLWAGEGDANLLSQLKFRHIGPIGNRVSAVVGVPGDRNVYYVGGASGGVFKTSDGGVHWEPVFDGQPAASIGSLAIAPSDPNVIWAGTGETFIRSNVSIGNGVYRSTDAGATWRHLGLEKTGRIGRILVDPRDPDVALVAAMGHCYGPQQERGVYRTSDGGETWERTLFVDENTGASDLAVDPNNPRIVYAGMWPMRIWTWGRESGGPGGGLWKSADGGVTWDKLSGHGLPEPPLGKIGLTISAENSSRVYALIETNSNHDFAELEDHDGVLWRSDDAGQTWEMVNGDHTLAQRPLYYSRALAAPDRSNEIYFLSTQFSRSLDAGKSYERMDAGGDNHDMWIDPKIPDRMIVGHDGGISISLNRGKTWFRPQLPVAQMYHAYTDDRVPYYVYGNRQDGGSYRGPSNNLSGEEIGIGEWRSVGGCESGFAVPDPVNRDIVWSGCYEGILERHDLRTGHTRNVSVWPDNPEAWPAKELKYRFQWTFPIAVSPHDSNKVYVGSQFVHQTVDGGNSWTVISPDLTGNDKERQQKTGGLTPDDAGPTIAPVIFAIAESPLKSGLIWAGSNDGRIHVTRDGGKKWVDVTANIPDLPPWGTVSNIEPSRFDEGTAYVAFDLHQVNDTNPYLYKTADHGQTWVSISSDLPRSVFSYAHCLREDPERRGLLYLGTENGIYFSLNEGANWRSLQNNLPHAPVYWLTVQRRFSDLVVATYGRGFWILDDISPLRQLGGEEREPEVRLFAPRDGYRLRAREGAVSQPEDPAAGQNPPEGVSIHYFLKEAVSEGVKLSILDSAGKTVREFESGEDSDDLPAEAGLNRFWWDLRYERSKEPKLRTKPLEHSHVPLGDNGLRTLREGRRFGPLAPPGVYQLKLEVAGQEFVQKLTVLKDPTTAGSEEDIRKTSAVTLDLRDKINSAVATIQEIEQYRWQIESLRSLLEGREGSAEVLEAAAKLNSDLEDLEGEFFDLRLTNARQDTLRWPRRLYSKMTILASVIDQSDYPPTVQQMEVYSLYKQRLEELQARLKQQREGPISSLNQRLRGKGFPTLVGTSQ